MSGELLRIYVAYITLKLVTKQKKCSVSREIYPEVCRENQACLGRTNEFVFARLATARSNLTPQYALMH